MGIELIFQWHKLLHFIMPILIICIFCGKFGKTKTIAMVILLGILKEIRDILLYSDPLWLCGTDTLFNIIGIMLGLRLRTILEKVMQRWRAEVMNRKISKPFDKKMD